MCFWISKNRSYSRWTKKKKERWCCRSSICCSIRMECWSIIVEIKRCLVNWNRWVLELKLVIIVSTISKGSTRYSILKKLMQVLTIQDHTSDDDQTSYP